MGRIPVRGQADAAGRTGNTKPRRKRDRGWLKAEAWLPHSKFVDLIMHGEWDASRAICVLVFPGGNLGRYAPKCGIRNAECGIQTRKSTLLIRARGYLLSRKVRYSQASSRMARSFSPPLVPQAP